jgi:hypothetical protein
MHERGLDNEDEDERPIWVANDRRDGGLRDDWREVAEVIANIENRSALYWVRRKREGFGGIDDDDIDPGFIMVGRRRSLSAIAEATSGIIEHGQAFRAWADLVGDDPEALHRFSEAFLGSWGSAAEFAQQVLGELGPLSADEFDEDQQLRILVLASELADELERRGVISAVPNPKGGVWVFRPCAEEPPEREADAAEGGRHA